MTEPAVKQQKKFFFFFFFHLVHWCCLSFGKLLVVFVKGVLG